MPFCMKCGAKLDDSAMFCDMCGTRVENEGTVAKPAIVNQPVNSAPKPLPQTNKPATAKSKKKVAKHSNKKKMIFLFLVAGIVLLGAGTFVTVILLNKSKNEIKYPDTKKYFAENFEVLSNSPAGKSKDAFSEKDIIVELETRGFNEFPITFEYSIDGSFGDPREASKTSADKHPVYKTYYISKNNKTWNIIVIEGTIMVLPSSYNAEHSDKVPIVISESEEIVSYDSSDNSFYRTIPNKTTLNVLVVDRIDAKTIESLNLES